MSFQRAASEFVADINVPLPVDFPVTVAALLGRLDLDHAADHLPSADIVAAGWRRFLDHESSSAMVERESLETISLLGAFHKFMSGNSDEMRGAFQAQGLDFARSRIEAMLRLSGRLFMLGRKRALRRDAARIGHPILTAAIKLFTEVLQSASNLPAHRLRMLYGMRGVAQLIIARSETDAHQGLLAAASDLAQAYEMGDQSPQNVQYQRECALRILENDPNEESLAVLDAMLRLPCPVNRQYLSDLAHYNIQAALLQQARGANVSDLISAGLKACERGFACPPDENTADAVFSNLYGFLIFLRAQTEPELDQDAIVSTLTLAIDHLRAAAEIGMGGASLAQALLRRGSRLKAADLNAAERDFEEALTALDLIGNPAVASRVRSQLAAALADNQVRRLTPSSDLPALIAACRDLLALDEFVGFHLHTLINAVRALYRANAEAVSPRELREVTEATVQFGLKELQEFDGTTDRAGLLAGYLAGLSRRLDTDWPSDRTINLFRTAIERQLDPPVELYSLAGDVSLQIGKRLAQIGRADEAAQHFEDATIRLEHALGLFEQMPEDASSSFLPVVGHSKLGEAYLRMRSGRDGPRVASSKAIEHLTKSCELGNKSKEVFGLLGDAYYRRGYGDGNVDDLVMAAAHKIDAQRLGATARENWSVLTRIHHRLFEMRGDAADLARALDAVLNAHHSDRDWPWPFFQMADLASVGDAAAIEAARAQLRNDVAASLILEPVWTADRAALVLSGARLAASSTEFRKHIVGGRSKVFVLDDPHRLLSTAMILKPTGRRNAEIEMTTIAAFGKYLAELDLSSRFVLPTPLCVLEGERSEVIYVMERALATPLARLVLAHDSTEGGVMPEVVVAMDFLAHFHTWAGTTPSDGPWRRRLMQTFAGYLAKLSSRPDNQNAALADFSAILPDHLPLVRKKDGHPENWLLTRSGSVMMIDLESTAMIPVLLDVVQLLDDYPALPTDSDGWSQRMSLCDRYWSQIVGSPDRDLIPRTYAALLIFRCLFGFLHCSGKLKEETASSALGALALRLKHYRSVLAWLAVSDLFPVEVRRLADYLVCLVAE